MCNFNITKGINAKYVNLWQGSANKATKQYDVVVANIIADVLVFIYKDISKVAKDKLILSGIIDKYKNKVVEKYSKNFKVVEEIAKNEWVTLILQRV